jgi:NADPH:quinone reductase-like Zn-dependent oxidoreductase
MTAIRLQLPGGVDALTVERAQIPTPGSGEALVRVHAAAITRDELDWPVDRLPAIPSYELSGTIVALAPDASGFAVGAAVYGLTPFDRDGVAAEYAVVPLAGLTAWQGLFDHGRLRDGQRVLIHGAAGGVGHFATQLARWRGAHVIGTATGSSVEAARKLGADEVLDRASVRFEETVEPVDLVFDTVGGETLKRSPTVLRKGGRLVSVAEEPPQVDEKQAEAVYFVVRPSSEQLVELAGLVDEGTIAPAIDSVFPLTDARKAFERVMERGKRGKVILEIARA